MDLRPGYKQTDLGMLPEQWDCVCIGDAAANSANAIVGGPFGSDLVSADYVVAGVPVIRGQNMSAGLVSGDFVFVSREKAKSLSANLAHAGDLVFTQRGTLGQVSMVPGEGFDSYLISQSQMKVSLNKTRHDPHFVRQYFSSSAGQKQIVTSAIQTGVPHTNLGILRAYRFPAPLLPEQRAIATALSDADALLVGLDRLIAKKRDLKQAAMQQLLTGQTRLPGFHAEWESGNLGSVIAALDAGVSVNSVEHDQGDGFDGKFILKTSAVAGGRFIPSQSKRVAPRDLSRACLNPQKGTIIISRMNTPDLVGECGYVDRDYPSLFVPDRLWMTRFRQGFHQSGQWLSYLLSTAALKQQIGAAATGTSGSMKNLSKHALLRIPIVLPSSPEQSAIAAVLSDLDAELAALEARRDKTRALKHGMMQELLTGRTRFV